MPSSRNPLFIKHIVLPRLSENLSVFKKTAVVGLSVAITHMFVFPCSNTPDSAHGESDNYLLITSPEPNATSEQRRPQAVYSPASDCAFNLKRQKTNNRNIFQYIKRTKYQYQTETQLIKALRLNCL